MLRGSIIHDYVNVGPKFSRACRQAMDGDVALVVPWTSELNIAAMALLGVAWLTLVLGLRWQLRTKAVAALPGLATLAVALAGAVAIDDARQAAARHSEYNPPLMVLVMTFEVLAVVALLWIAAWQPEARWRHILRLAIALSGTTAFGYAHIAIEYLTMIRFSRLETPPGYAYLTAATITISAILTAIMTLGTPQKGADDEPGQDDHSGSLTLA
jgi:hypothetical protein